MPVRYGRVPETTPSATSSTNLKIQLEGKRGGLAAGGRREEKTGPALEVYDVRLEVRCAQEISPGSDERIS